MELGLRQSKILIAKIMELSLWRRGGGEWRVGLFAEKVKMRRWRSKGYDGLSLGGLFAEKRFQEMEKVAQAVLLLLVAARGGGGERFKLAVDLGLCLVVDAPVGDAVGSLL